MGGAFGGMSPFPFSFGGGSRPLEGLTQALNASRGYAYDASTWSSTVSIENRAFARFLYARWATNQRAQNQFDMTRVTDLIPRWERIFIVFPLPTDNDSTRRVRLQFKDQQESKQPWYQQIYDDLTTKMGPVFVQIVHTSSADVSSVTLYPGSAATNPYDLSGATVEGVSEVDWSSPIGHIAIQVTQPAGMPIAVFNQALEEMALYLDGALPSWVMFSSFSEVGFVLDQTNLGVACLDG